MVSVICTRCKVRFQAEASRVNRAAVESPGKLYCSRECAGLARRKPKLPESIRKARKAAYDVLYRATHVEERREQKREWYQINRDPGKERRVRKKNMARHVAYCRKYYADPKRKRSKVEYDKRRRKKLYGDFAEAWRVLLLLEREIRRRVPDKYERAIGRGYYERSAQQRKRDAQINRW